MVENPKLKISMSLDITINYEQLSVIQLQSIIILAQEEIEKRQKERWGDE